jgi:hypothetical protein
MIFLGNFLSLRHNYEPRGMGIALAAGLALAIVEILSFNAKRRGGSGLQRSSASALAAIIHKSTTALHPAIAGGGQGKCD